MEEELQCPDRIGNIGFRICETLGPNPREYVDVAYYYHNPLYGHESDYIKKGEWYYYPDRVGSRMHESCFKHPENCYTLATIDIEEEPDVVSVGLRPFDLKEREKKHYERIIRQACAYARYLWCKRNNRL